MTSAKVLHPLDAGLVEVGAASSGLPFPPNGWEIIQEWGLGYALRHSNGLRVLIDCSQKSDESWWVHVSFSRKAWTPSHEDACIVKRDFLGDRYAYAVHPPRENYVNIHNHCLHLWAVCDQANGAVLPEFSDVLEGIGRSI
jgi:hypothetical protein